MPNTAVGMLLIVCTAAFVIIQCLRIVAAVRRHRKTSHFDHMLLVHQSRLEIQKRQASAAINEVPPAAVSPAMPSSHPHKVVS